MDYLSTNMIRLRKAKGITQEQVGKALGVSQGTVSRFEKGKIGSLKHRQVMQLAKLFEVSIGDLVEHDFADGPAPAKTSHADIDLRALASALVALDKAMQALNIPYRQVHDMAPTLRYAYKALVRNPDLPNSDRALFDDALIGKLRENLDAASSGPKRRPPAGNRSSEKAAKAQPPLGAGDA